MRVGFQNHDPKRHRFVVERAPHPPIDVLYESRSMLLHDFAHYAVEGALGTEAGFYGWLARGADPTELRENGGIDDEALAVLMGLEGQVALLQSAFKRNQGSAGPADSWNRLRAVFGAWRKCRQTEILWLPWPAGAPEVHPG